ncbi:serine/threonine-protein kinase [Actinomadura vinacea]
MEPLRSGDPAQVGAYRLVARLGAGGTGRVYLGHDSSGDLVAIKVVHAHIAHRQDRRDRFAREIAAVRGIDPAYIAPVVDHDMSAAEPWLATAYLRGPTLQQMVELRGPLAGPSVRVLGAALAKALAAIHRAGVLHRDLKPSNLVLAPDGPRVVDFGIARPDGADTITAPGSLLGTPGYIPPERIRLRNSGPEGDVFAFGAVLVYAGTGEGPFGTGSVPSLLYRTQFEEPRLDALRAALDDPRLTEIIVSCLAREPGWRPTAEQLVGRFTEAPDPGYAPRLPDEAAVRVTDPDGRRWAPHTRGS